YACHGGVPLRSGRTVGGLLAVQQFLDALGVIRRHLGAAIEASGALGRLVLEQVPTVGLLAHDLAGPGQPEPLGGAAVGLRLGHECPQFCGVSVCTSLGSALAAGAAGASASCAAFARVFA